MSHLSPSSSLTPYHWYILRSKHLYLTLHLQLYIQLPILAHNHGNLCTSVSSKLPTKPNENKPISTHPQKILTIGYNLYVTILVHILLGCSKINTNRGGPKFQIIIMVCHCIPNKIRFWVRRISLYQVSLFLQINWSQFYLLMQSLNTPRYWTPNQNRRVSFTIKIEKMKTKSGKLIT